MRTLVIDIESVGLPFESFDEETREALTHPLHKMYKTEETYNSAFETMKMELGLSALTGKAVAFGMLDAETLQGTVYFDTNGTPTQAFTEDTIQYIPAGEKQMLEAFWQTVPQYNQVVTFNGWGFDIPFAAHRSAFHGIKPSRNLMTSRFLFHQKGPVKHLDLQDLLSFNGATRRKGSLHLWCQAFGIPSPKVLGESGADVSRMYGEGQFATIARYNARDIVATKQLYDYWNQYLRFD